MRELLARLGSDELTEWMAYYRIEPWGGERGDLQAGIVAATVVNGLKAFAGDRSTSDAKPSDFTLVFGIRPAQTSEEMVAKLAQYTLSRGGEVR